MFSRDDFIGYFDQISRVAGNIAATAGEMSAYVRDEPWADVLVTTQNDANRHRRMLEAIVANFTAR